MALQTVSIVKNGTGIQILYYSANSAASTSDVTLFNPNGTKVFANGSIVTIDPENITALNFTQSVGGTNRITSICGVDVSAFTAAQVVTELDKMFKSGFGGSSPILLRKAVPLHLTTNGSDGTAFVLFADTPCDAIDIVNASGTALEYQRDGTSVTMYLPDNSSRMVEAITNANQIGIRRIDTTTAQVTISAEALLS